MNRRLQARGLRALMVKEDGKIGPATLRSIRTCAWALGAQPATLERIASKHEVPIGVSSMIRNPGKRTDAQLELAAVRIANMRKQRKLRAHTAHSVSAQRQAICDQAKRARAHYNANPRAYHYLAGGIANTVIMTPTSRSWRSDCSQFAVNTYREAGVPCPGSGTYLYSNTGTIAARGTVTTNPRPGDLGMYGPRNATHHVEVYIGDADCEFIGHGSPPIDSLTPGRPDFYLSFLD